MSDAISCEVHNGVAVLTIDDGKANALGSPQFAALAAGLDHAQAHAEAVVLAGRPGILSGGFDLKVLRAGDDAAVQHMISDGVRFMMRLYGHPQPVVAAATGHAVALGAFVLLAADHRVGANGEFNVGLNEVAIGLDIPPFGLMLGQRRLASQHQTSAMINARIYTPEQAVQVGYLDEAVPQQEVIAVALQRAAELAKLDSRAFAATKQNLRRADIDKILSDLG